MNLPTVVISIVLIILFTLACIKIYKDRKKGGCGCGCNGCNSCSQNHDCKTKLSNQTK